MSEFDLIERIRQRTSCGANLVRDDVLLGIGDDAAVLRVPPGHDLVAAVDTLNVGVHFQADIAPADLGWKALAVNLSDLAAMGAIPAWCLLSLSLPHADPDWLDGFIDGFAELAARHRVALVGGDTTRGPLSVCVTAHGLVESSRALRRDGARPGDGIWVSGTLGDAAAALAQLQAGGVADPGLRQRLDRPEPRVALGRHLAGLASACIDLSDGLLQDLAHVCRRSGVNAEVQVDALPVSAALAARSRDDTLRGNQACGGDDYELCFTLPAEMEAELARLAAECDAPVTRVGTIVESATEKRGDASSLVCAMTHDGELWQAPRGGYAHFA